jgi:hypothetical protein
MARPQECRSAPPTAGRCRCAQTVIRLARRSQHSQGERQFWDEIDINPLMVCAELYAVRGDLVAMQAVITKTIAGRGR